MLAAGACVFQYAGCAQMASETVVRIGFDMVFLPINSAVVSLFQVI